MLNQCKDLVKRMTRQKSELENTWEHRESTEKLIGRQKTWAEIVYVKKLKNFRFVYDLEICIIKYQSCVIGGLTIVTVCTVVRLILRTRLLSLTPMLVDGLVDFPFDWKEA